jgi:hypothetical protein
MFEPLGAFFKLAFFEAAPVSVGSVFLRASIILERENDELEILAALPLRFSWVPFSTAAGGRFSSSISELVQLMARRAG